MALKKLFLKDRAVCCSCGHKWNVIYLNIPNGQYKLQCPKCKKRNSDLVKKRSDQ